METALYFFLLMQCIFPFLLADCIVIVHEVNHHTISVSVYLAENISVGVVLQEHCGGARVVVSRSDVQCREADLALGTIVDEQCHNIFMALLERYCQGSEAILRDGTASERDSEMTEKVEEVGRGKETEKSKEEGGKMDKVKRCLTVSFMHW